MKNVKEFLNLKEFPQVGELGPGAPAAAAHGGIRLTATAAARKSGGETGKGAQGRTAGGKCPEVRAGAEGPRPPGLARFPGAFHRQPSLRIHGMPDSVRFPLTDVRGRDGVISDDVRLFLTAHPDALSRALCAGFQKERAGQSADASDPVREFRIRERSAGLPGRIIRQMIPLGTEKTRRRRFEGTRQASVREKTVRSARFRRAAGPLPPCRDSPGRILRARPPKKKKFF